ncbi:hypothetical protein [Candidatus Nitrosocosmicus sp. FF01]|jgi:hypothetical protein|uniref:hypothetical protein n=1 Tax=Candidatus Nitrosocosmicus sp. FF01 TaxID=3397670 RepID=UPI0039EC664E
MNTRIVYAVGIGIIIIGIVFYFLFNSGFIAQNPNSNDPTASSLNSSQGNLVGSNQNQAEFEANGQLLSQQPNYQNLSLSINSVKVIPVNDELRLEVAFNAYNPNKGTAILETISYNVYLDDLRLSSGDVGSRTEGFVDSLESVFTIIGNQTIVLRDKEPLTEEAQTLFDPQGNLIEASSSNGSDSGTVAKINEVFDVNGTYFYTLNRGSDAQVGEHSFSFQYPTTTP